LSDLSAKVAWRLMQWRRQSFAARLAACAPLQHAATAP
jgi:hypothetical protein